jgi:Virulence-associated protein E
MSILSELSNQRRFVVYALLPNPEHPGKTDKIPCDPLRGYANTFGRINGQDRNNWLLPAEAEVYAACLSPEPGVISYGVGIVLYEKGGIAAIDLDSCREPSGGWQPHVDAFLRMFPGAYFEASVSMTGGHIFVAYAGELPPHGTRNADYRAEAYTRERFIALGTHLTGSVLVDNSERLRSFLETYFPPRADETGALWTTGPVAAWRGPADDAALIAKAVQSRSASATWDKGASFAALWKADADVLGRAFPSQNPASPWDGSAADLALANHLAFWTGNDCERMARLMKKSALVRSKWDRADYFTGTILRACSSQTEWYSERAQSLPVASTPVSPTAQQSGMPDAVTGGTAAPSPPAALVAPSVSVTVEGAAVPQLSAFTLRINGKGLAEATLPNVVHQLTEQTQTRVGFDTFRGRIMITRSDVEAWRALDDEDMVQLRETLEKEMSFAAVGRELMRDALLLVSKRLQFDSAMLWLSNLQWDGVQRIGNFLHTYAGTEDDEYTRAVSRYIWSGLACRVMEPGCQLDMVVALFSKHQGLYKSSALAEMVPHTDFFSDSLDLYRDDDDFKRKIKGKLVCEIAEMAGMSTASIEHVKRVIPRRREEWIEKWQTLPTIYPRRCMLFATTNEEQFLPKDDSGQRRWLPVEIVRILRDLIKRDRDQLWAEGLAFYRMRKEQGLPGVNFEEAEILARGRHARHEQGDVWEQLIQIWLHVPAQAPNGVVIPPPAQRPFTTDEVLMGALLMNKDKMDDKSSKRVGRVLRQLGYESTNMRINGVQGKRWAPKV